MDSIFNNNNNVDSENEQRKYIDFYELDDFMFLFEHREIKQQQVQTKAMCKFGMFKSVKKFIR